MPREFQEADAMNHRPQLHFRGEVVLTFNPTVTSPKNTRNTYTVNRKGTGQPPTVTSKQVVPACLSSTAPLTSFCFSYFLWK